MMTHKIVIANSKMAQSGKSSSIRYVFEVLSERYHHVVIEPSTGYDRNSDVKAIIDIPQPNGDIVKVGIESQGDPNSRQNKSIDYFLKAGCEIILVACRTRGKTVNKIEWLRGILHWQAIWFDNSSMWVDSWCNVKDDSGTCLSSQDTLLQNQLSWDYGFYVASLIERLVLTGGVIKDLKHE